MISQVMTSGICNMQVQIIRVETLVLDGLPDIEVVGDVDSKVRESVKRVLGAAKNAGVRLAPKKLIINFYPAEIRKKGSHMDMAIAASILGAYALVDRKKFEACLFMGEIGLSGKVLPVRGALPIVLEAVKQGIKTCYLPVENMAEVSVITGINIVGISSLTELVQILQGRKKISVEEALRSFPKTDYEKDYPDFKDVLGQPAVKRAAKIAAAGMHSFLMIGPPGTGKTMTAKRLLGILPPLSETEGIELTKMYSMSGLLSDREPYINQRKIRLISSDVQGRKLVGNAVNLQPGEMMLANRGILFLDELSAFSPNILEMIRQAFDEKKVITDVAGKKLEFPANFMLVACMNGCKCGGFPDKTKCTCSISEIKRHAGRISQSFLDRIEICVHFPDVDYDMISEASELASSEGSGMMRNEVQKAYEMQKERYKGTDFVTNGDLSGDVIRKYCRLGKSEEHILKMFYESQRLSVRSCHNILKVSRTIADIAQSEEIKENHLIEAIGLRSIDRNFWKV